MSWIKRYCRLAGFPTADWTTLEQKVGKDKLARFDGAMNPNFLVMSALVHQGVLYHKPSHTPLDDYPYPRTFIAAR